MNESRRTLLKIGGAALAMIPVAAIAKKNDAMRASMKYKDSPEAGKKCADCVQFVPAGAKGGCKLFPGDDEVSPNGYCVAFAKKP